MTELDAIRDRLTKAATEVGYEFAAHEFGQRPTTSAKLSDAQCDFKAASKAFDDFVVAIVYRAAREGQRSVQRVHENLILVGERPATEIRDAILKREAS